MRRKSSGFSSFLDGVESFVEVNWRIILLLIFLAGFVARLAPYISQPGLPYGEHDAAYHFQMSRMVSEGGYPQDCVGCLNTKHYLGGYFYPPGFHTTAALLGIYSFLDMTSVVHITSAILDCLLVLTSFLLVRELYGVLPALSCSLVLSMSARNIQSVFWGQWPSYFGMALIPLVILYGFRGLKDIRQMLLCGLFSGFTFVVYPQWSIYSAFIVACLHVLTDWGRPRRLLKSLAVFFTVYAAVSAVPALYMASYASGREVAVNPSMDFGSLLRWYPTLDPSGSTGGYPNLWFSLRFYPPVLIWLYALSILSSLFCVKDRRLLVPLLTLVAFYIFAHLDVIGLASHERVITQYHIESFVFALFLPCLFLLKKRSISDYSKVVALSLVCLFFLMTLVYDFPRLFSVYGSGQRLTLSEMDAARWMRYHTPKNATFGIVGPIRTSLVKWFTAYSDRRLLLKSGDHFVFEDIRVDIDKPDYAIIEAKPRFGGGITEENAATESGYGREVFDNGFVKIKEKSG